MRTDSRWPFLSVVVIIASYLNLCASLASGAPAMPDQARRAVAGWLRLNSRPLETPLGGQVDRVETFRDDRGQALYYVVYLSPSGFVIVPADDLVEPIIGFVREGVYDPSSDNPLGCLVSRDLAGRMAAVKAAASGAPRAKQAADVARGKWSRLLGVAESTTGNSPLAGMATISDVRVGPLVQSKWSQDNVSGNYCYNYYTPNHYVCGCTATAMSQVMRFYQCPTTGVGVVSCSVTVDGNPQTLATRGGNGSGGAYDWANMVLDPAHAGSVTDAQRQAIGALCYDAGVAAKMAYASGGSGAYFDDAKNALINVFKYSNAISVYNNDEDLGTWLTNMADADFDAGFPILIEIRDSSGDDRHAIVADGYGYDQATLYRHLNYGWAGSTDAWYNLPNMGAGYTVVYGAIYNIFTTGTGEIISGRVLDSDGNPVSGATVTATRTGGSQYTAATNAKGIYALAKVPSASTYTVTAAKTGYTFGSRSVTTGTSQNGQSASGNRWGMDLTPQTVALGITGIAPASGGNLESAVPVVISGTAFSSSTTVRLTRTGQSDISGTGVTADSSTSLRCTFNLNGAAVGAWIVVVQDADNHSASLANGFAVVREFTLTAATAGGNGTISPTAGKYASGSQVSLTAAPDTGYRVKRWTGTDNDTLTTKTNIVTMTADKVVTVEFEPSPKHQYTGSVSAGRGTLSPASGSYFEGTQITLRATPATGYLLKSWTGTDNDSSTSPTNTVTLNADKSVTVAFDPDLNWRFELSTIAIGEHGTISPGPIMNYIPGTVVELAAVPDEGYSVRQWAGTDNDESTANTNTVTMDEEKVVTVEFAITQYRLETLVVGGSGTLWPAGGSYDMGLAVPLTARPASGFRVRQWAGTDNDISTGTKNTVTMSEDKLVTVEFEPIADWGPTPTASWDIPTGTPTSGGPGGCGAAGIAAITLALLGGLSIFGRSA